MAFDGAPRVRLDPPPSATPRPTGRSGPFFKRLLPSQQPNLEMLLGRLAKDSPQANTMPYSGYARYGGLMRGTGLYLESLTAIQTPGEEALILNLQHPTDATRNTTLILRICGGEFEGWTYIAGEGRERINLREEQTNANELRFFASSEPLRLDRVTFNQDAVRDQLVLTFSDGSQLVSQAPAKSMRAVEIHTPGEAKTPERITLQPDQKEAVAPFSSTGFTPLARKETPASAAPPRDDEWSMDATSFYNTVNMAFSLFMMENWETNPDPAKVISEREQMKLGMLSAMFSPRAVEELNAVSWILKDHRFANDPQGKYAALRTALRERIVRSIERAPQRFRNPESAVAILQGNLAELDRLEQKWAQGHA